MMKVFFFLVLLAGNILWLSIVIGLPMTHWLAGNKSSGRIIAAVVGTLSLVFTLMALNQTPAERGDCRESPSGYYCD